MAFPLNFKLLSLDTAAPLTNNPLCVSFILGMPVDFAPYIPIEDGITINIAHPPSIIRASSREVEVLRSASTDLYSTR